MLYHFPLRTTALIVGLLLLIAHLLALWQGPRVRQWLAGFCRSRVAGIVLLTLAFVWTYWLLATMDLGEITHLRKWFLLLLPVGYFLTMFFVDDFLSVRALAALLLLAADPLLCAAFLRPEGGRILLVLVAYAWIVAGLFWIGLPHLLRDQIQWVTASPGRWKLAAAGGAVYGAALVVLSLVHFQS